MDIRNLTVGVCDEMVTFEGKAGPLEELGVNVKLRDRYNTVLGAIEAGRKGIREGAIQNLGDMEEYLSIVMCEERKQWTDTKD